MSNQTILKEISSYKPLTEDELRVAQEKRNIKSEAIINYVDNIGNMIKESRQKLSKIRNIKKFPEDRRQLSESTLNHCDNSRELTNRIFGHKINSSNKNLVEDIKRKVSSSQSKFIQDEKSLTTMNKFQNIQVKDKIIDNFVQISNKKKSDNLFESKFASAEEVSNLRNELKNFKVKIEATLKKINDKKLKKKYIIKESTLKSFKENNTFYNTKDIIMNKSISTVSSHLAKSDKMLDIGLIRSFERFKSSGQSSSVNSSMNKFERSVDKVSDESTSSHESNDDSEVQMKGLLEQLTNKKGVKRKLSIYLKSVDNIDEKKIIEDKISIINLEISSLKHQLKNSETNQSLNFSSSLLDEESVSSSDETSSTNSSQTNYNNNSYIDSVGEIDLGNVAPDDGFMTLIKLEDELIFPLVHEAVEQMFFARTSRLRSTKSALFHCLDNLPQSFTSRNSYEDVAYLRRMFTYFGDDIENHTEARYIDKLYLYEVIFDIVNKIYAYDDKLNPPFTSKDVFDRRRNKMMILWRGTSPPNSVELLKTIVVDEIKIKLMDSPKVDKAEGESDLHKYFKRCLKEGVNTLMVSKILKDNLILNMNEKLRKMEKREGDINIISNV